MARMQSLCYAYAVDLPADPTTLTLDAWTDGEISAGGEVWYSFTASSGTTYYVSWNDGHEGSGSKTGDIKVSAYDSGGSVIFLPQDSGWTTPHAVSGQSGTVYLKVEGKDSAYSPYAIKYSTSSEGNVTLSTPTGLTATASVTSVSLSWNSVSGASSYKVYRGNSPGGSYSQIGTASSNSYTDTGLSSGTYYYRVSAVNSSGVEGPQSSYASATVASGGGGSNTLSLSNAPTAYAVFVTTATLSSSSTYNDIASNYIAIGSGTTGSTAALTWTSGGNGTYNVLIYTGTETKYQNGVNFSNGSASLNWNSMSTAGGGGGTGGTLTITGLPSGTYAVYAITGNPSTYMEFATMMTSASGIGAISGTTFAWGTTPSNGTYNIILYDNSAPTTLKKATSVTITNGGGSVAYGSFVTLPMN